jgi:uncharacterized protein YdbL (DUF1318 family)
MMLRAKSLRTLLTVAAVAASTAGISGCIRVKLDPIDVKLDVKLTVESQLSSSEAMTPALRERFEQRLPEIIAAKKTGRIGETFDGYVDTIASGSAQADSSLDALIKAENADRLTYYQAVARSAQASLAYVGELSAMKRFEAATSGEYLRHRDGQWKQKTPGPSTAP